MNARRRPMVLSYAIGSAIVVVALALVTHTVVRQHATHANAVAEALHQEDIRTALWRMETRVGSLLAMTTSRASVAPPAPGAYAANALAGFQNTISADERPPDALAHELIAAADHAFDLACNAGSRDVDFAPSPEWTNPEQQVLGNRGVQRSADEFARRSGSNFPSQISMPPTVETGASEVLVGPLATCWDTTGVELGLQFARRIQGPGGASHESYRIEWSELSSMLLAEIQDLFPTAKLEPVDPMVGTPSAQSGAELALRLAAVPARLVVPPPLPAEGLPRDHLWALAGAWLALVVSLGVGLFALRTSYAYGDKHRRFTHAVTHELRTPLTTFRLYSEMLARGMVPAEKQPEYLATLEKESERLARLVDNVLRYARLEDGKHAAPRTTLSGAELVERCVPELARTCVANAARLELDERIEGGARVETDPEAVLQILSNLVENACKYAHVENDAVSTVRLRSVVVDGRLALDVCDDGPGVPAAVARSIFDPFERGGRDSSDPARGVGLGLALSRALAAELGGTLTLVRAERGATFRLSLPLANEHQ